MFLDDEDFLDLSVYGVYEPGITALVKREVKEGDVVLDLGANVGYYTLLFAKLVGETGKVFAFEPDPRFFSLLKKNVEINGYKNVILEQKAVTNRTGMMRLFLEEGTYTVHESEGGRESIEVESVSLDDYFSLFQKGIDFIKMDIEGSEGYAIDGMSGLLEKNGHIKIVTEYWPMGLKSYGPERYLNLLQQHKFTLYHIDEEEKSMLPITIPRFIESFSPDSEDGTNIYCVKE
jgi:FkbM family methyltransferase